MSKLLSQADKRLLWGPPCPMTTLQTYSFGQGNARLRPECFVPLVLLSRALRKHDRWPRRFDTWSYACRAIAGTSSWSMHAFGIAVDVRATSYPLGVRVTDQQLLAAAGEVEALVTPDGWRVWEWGGRWRRPDGMHWEIACPPASAALLTLPRKGPAEPRALAWSDELVGGREPKVSCGA